MIIASAHYLELVTPHSEICLIRMFHSLMARLAGLPLAMSVSLSQGHGSELLLTEQYTSVIIPLALLA